MWILLAIGSALSLGFYDIFKKLSLNGNNVAYVLFLNTLFCTLLLSPVLFEGITSGTFGFGAAHNHLFILTKSVIVLSSWALGYMAIKHLPLTITGSVNATRPVMVLVGALLIFSERLNPMQWIGITLGFMSLFVISHIGSKEGFSLKHSKWLWLCIASTFLGAVSALYDKFLMKRFDPMPVQAWYTLYQCLLMGAVLLVMHCKPASGNADRFQWRWSIPLISVFITAGDLAYFYALSLPGSMVAIVSMIRRGSVLVSFCYGAIFLHEKNIKMKLIDLTVLLVGLTFIIIGSLE
ncbi:MAG: DMT family transporter [Sodaliphilus sp.]|nr:DMT family transporter [Sodaliphilus sp.]